MRDWFAGIAKKVADKPSCDVARVADVARAKKPKKSAIFGARQSATSRYRLGVASVAKPIPTTGAAALTTSATSTSNLDVADAPTEKLTREQAISRPATPATLATPDFVSGRVFADVPVEWEEGVAKIITMRCPGGVSAERWRQLELDSCGFIWNGWAAKAAALGWEILDLWGCHPHKPSQRLDLAGALWLVGGDDITAISDNLIAIRTNTGSQLAISRRKRAAGEPVCLAWELER